MNDLLIILVQTHVVRFCILHFSTAKWKEKATKFNKLKIKKFVIYLLL